MSASTVQTMPALGFHNVKKSFLDAHGTRFYALDSVNIVIPTGQVVALLGPNGAGKSTFIDLALGLIRPDSGNVQIFGDDAVRAVKQGRVSVMMQSGGLLPDIQVLTLLKMFASLYDGANLDACIEMSGVSPILGRRISQCSGGEIQKVRFALALIPDPELIILDEPTAAVDVEARRDFWHTMRNQAAVGRTVLFATHYLEEADHFADRIILISQGKLIAEGTSAEIRAHVSGRFVSAVMPEAQKDIVTRQSFDAHFVEYRGDRCYFTTAQSDALLKFLLSETDAHEIEVTSLGLEDAFLALTKKASHKGGM